MFSIWDRWDIALLAVASYVAVFALVKLMRARREQLLVQLRTQIEQEHERQHRRPHGGAPQSRPSGGRDAA